VPDVVFGSLGGQTDVQREVDECLLEFIGALGVEPQVVEQRFDAHPDLDLVLVPLRQVVTGGDGLVVGPGQLLVGVAHQRPQYRSVFCPCGGEDLLRLSGIGAVDIGGLLLEQPPLLADVDGLGDALG
jgi:hypothetical protein